MAEPDARTYGLFFLYYVSFPLVAFVVCWGLFKVVIYYIHYAVGAIILFFLITVICGLYSGFFQWLWVDRMVDRREPHGIEPHVPIVRLTRSISVLVTVILILITVFAWISYALCELALATVLPPSAIATYDNLIKTYAWHLVQVIPLTNVEKTLGMQDPQVQFQGWIAGAPILAFRFLIVVTVFAAVRDAWKTFQKSSEDAFIARIEQRVEKDATRKEGD